MLRLHASFLLRVWRLSDGERRLEVEHIPSGARTRVGSIAAALDWIETYVGGPAQGEGRKARDDAREQEG